MIKIFKNHEKSKKIFKQKQQKKFRNGKIPKNPPKKNPNVSHKEQKLINDQK